MAWYLSGWRSLLPADFRIQRGQFFSYCMGTVSYTHLYKVCGINPDEEMNWKQFLKALLILNAFWFFWGMVLLVSQGWLPLNPDGNGPQTPDQAFNTCISFMAVSYTHLDVYKRQELTKSEC